MHDLECPKKFQILRVLNQWPEEPNSYDNRFPNALHAALRDVFDPTKGIPPHTDRIDLYAKQAIYAARYSDPAQREVEISRCKLALRRYLANDSEEDITGTIAVEVSGRFSLGNPAPICEVSARLDRIIVRESDPNTLIVRDYKTGRPRIDLAVAFVQLFVAMALYPDYEKYAVEYDWIDLTSGTVERDTVNGTDLRGVIYEIASRVIEFGKSTDYPAHPGEVCTYCPLRSKCQPSKTIHLRDMWKLFGNGAADPPEVMN